VRESGGTGAVIGGRGLLGGFGFGVGVGVGRGVRPDEAGGEGVGAGLRPKDGDSDAGLCRRIPGAPGTAPAGPRRTDRRLGLVGAGRTTVTTWRGEDGCAVRSTSLGPAGSKAARHR